MPYTQPKKLVMGALVAAIHFPEADCFLHRFWKMDGPDEPGLDGCGYRGRIREN
jgi:hypothetical protein